MLKKRLSNRYLRLVGFVLACLSVYYLVKLILEFDVSVLDYVLGESRNTSILLAGTVIYAIILLLGSLVWSRWVLTIDDSQPQEPDKTPHLMAIYLFTNLQKYIPGNVFQFLGRNLLGVRLGYSHKKLLMASGAELLSALTAGFVVLMLLLPLYYTQVLNLLNQYELSIFWGLGVVGLVLLILTSLVILNRQKMGPVFNAINFKLFFISVATIVVSFLLLSLINVLILSQFFDIEINWRVFSAITFVFTLSWLIGYLVPGAPGGIGIRELIFITLLEGQLASEVIIVTIVLMRVVNVLAELLTFLISWLYLRGRVAST